MKDFVFFIFLRRKSDFFWFFHSYYDSSFLLFSFLKNVGNVLKQPNWLAEEPVLSIDTFDIKRENVIARLFNNLKNKHLKKINLIA